MIANKKNEKWREFPLGYKSKFRYAVSNYGRLLSFSDKISNGKILVGGKIEGYKIFNYRFRVHGKVIYKHLFIHHLVATFFLPGKPEGKAFVLHLDHDRSHNHISNLKWATREEMIEHSKTSPRVIEANKKNIQNNFPRKTLYIQRKKRIVPAQFFPGEEWKEMQLPHKRIYRYAISNQGRIMSFIEKFEDGRILKPSTVDGYKLFYYKVRVGKKYTDKHLFIRKLVAQYFLPPPAPGQSYVLLKDRDRSNNRVENLRWANKKEMLEFQKKSPFVIKARLEKKPRVKGQKLTATQVQYIKQRLFDPNRKTRLKIIAKRFGVSEMALHRIKIGENWAHIKVKGQENYIRPSLLKKKNLN